MTTYMCGYASQREYRAFQTKCVSKVIDNGRDNLFYALFFIVVVIVSVVLIDALVFCTGVVKGGQESPSPTNYWNDEKKYDFNGCVNCP